MKMLRMLLSVCFVFLLTQQKATAQNNQKANADALEHISIYLDKLDNVAGTFLQIDQQGNTSTGQLLMKRPGMMRFDYDPPQKLKVVADGKWLAVQEAPGEKADRYPLSQTPLPIFWGKGSLSIRHSTFLSWTCLTPPPRYCCEIQREIFRAMRA